MKKLKPSYCILTFICVMFCLMQMGNGFAQNKIALVFHHTIGNAPLILGENFTTSLGEKIIVQKFKYYLSNFSVTNNAGKTTCLPVQYFLVDEADSISKIISLSIPAESLRSIQFLIGVDSIKNVSGVQTDALDPMKAMFWTWNSGYIMAKLEGSSTASTQAANLFAYHIGGFKGATNTTRRVSLSIPATQKPIKEIHITAELNQWFKSIHTLSIAASPVCNTPSVLAMKFADNYSTLFSISHQN